MIDRHAAPPFNPPVPTVRPLQSRRILLVEDGPDAQRLLTFMLQQEGAIVEVAENGRIAVDRVIEAAGAGLGEDFDLIVMDMQMPVMDGYEATAALRRRGYIAPIVALTAYVMTGDRERCLAAGCDEYFTKPVDRPRFLNALGRVLREADERSVAGAAILPAA